MGETLKTITVLLQLEAIDKAGKILEDIAGKFSSLKSSLEDAGRSSQLAGDELAAAQVKAEASENAYLAALRAQEEAQTALADSTISVKVAQEESAVRAEELEAAYQRLAVATDEAKLEAEVYYTEVKVQSEAAAKAVQSSVADQITALDALNKAEEEAAKKKDESATAQAKLNTENDSSVISYSSVSKAGMASAAAIAAIGYESIKSAANFQQATSVLVTSGGETEQNIGMVRDGILNLTATTGTATDQLVKGMYMIGSAGYTGSQGIAVLTASAKGAKSENADLGTVANAVTTIMRNYYGVNITVAQAQQYSTSTMNALIYATSHGKTTTEAMAGALAQVLPIAASTKMSLAQVTGAMSEMTAQGMSADQAAQDLRHTIDKLNAPTAAMTKEMALYGISAADVQSKLGERGLTGTLEILTKAITDKMGPAGRTVLNAFNQSKLAAQDADIVYKQLPVDLRKLADEVVHGTISYKDYNTAIKDLTPDQRSLMQQWENLHTQADGFNNLLRSSSQAAQTYQQALMGMTGDQTTFTTSLMLSGNNMQDFQTQVSGANQVINSGTKDISGWNDIQGNLNQQLSMLKGSVEVLAIKIGNDLLPTVTHIVEWFTKHKDIAETLATVIGITLVAATGAWITLMIGQGVQMLINGARLMLGLETSAKGAAVAEGEAATATRGFALASESAIGPLTALLGLSMALGSGGSTNLIQVPQQATKAMGDLNKMLQQVGSGSSDAKRQFEMFGTTAVMMSTENGHATQNLQDLDSAFADLVKNGHADQAKKDIDLLSGSLKGAHIDVSHLTDNLPNYKAALQSADDAQKGAAASAQSATEQIQQLDNATQTMDGTISSSTALTQMKTDMLGLKDAVAQNGTALNENTKEGLANEQQFNQLATEISQYRNQQIQATGDTNAANKTFNDQYNQLVTTAQGFGYGKDAVVAYLRQIGLVPQSVTTDISVNVDQGNLNDTLNKINQIIYDTNNGSLPNAKSGVRFYAHGGLVTGPGGPTSDSVPAMLSNGEYVIGADLVGKLGVGFFDSLQQGGLTSGVNIGPGGVSRIGQTSGGGVNMTMNFSFPGSVFAGPQAQNWLMQTLNKSLIQIALPQAGVQMARASA